MKHFSTLLLLLIAFNATAQKANKLGHYSYGAWIDYGFMNVPNRVSPDKTYETYNIGFETAKAQYGLSNSFQRQFSENFTKKYLYLGLSTDYIFYQKNILIRFNAGLNATKRQSELKHLDNSSDIPEKDTIRQLVYKDIEKKKILMLSPEIVFFLPINRKLVFNGGVAPVIHQNIFGNLHREGSLIVIYPEASDSFYVEKFNTQYLAKKFYTQVNAKIQIGVSYKVLDKLAVHLSYNKQFNLYNTSPRYETYINADAISFGVIKYLNSRKYK